MRSVSVVIPTRNRKEHLLKTLDSLKQQTSELYEVIVVDSSDVPLSESTLQEQSGIKQLRLINSGASVCLQRNIGIGSCGGEFIFLLDDDISLDKNYIEILLKEFQTHPNVLICSGLIMEKNDLGAWNYKQKLPHPVKLLWIYFFQLGLWAELSEQKPNVLWKGLYHYLQNQYQKMGNGISKAGWPVISSFDSPVFKTKIYGLGASIIRRDWLLEHLYEEKLEQHGIGDNYGIAMALNKEQAIHVLTNTKAFHFRAPTNRLSQAKAYYFRILALDYFSRQHNSASRSWLCWSLFGNMLSTLAGGHWEMFLKNLTLIWRIGTNQNPLLKKKLIP